MVKVFHPATTVTAKSDIHRPLVKQNIAMVRRQRHTGLGESMYHGHPAVAFFTFCLNSWTSGPIGSATIIYRTQTTDHIYFVCQ